MPALPVRWKAWSGVGKGISVRGKTEVAVEAARRRSIAVISHPDAGKSTLTEALALHAHAIDEPGAVHGKGNRAGVVSDWLEMEQKRGISITSAALQFAYRDVVINLLDTPGHADFSEDTYRVLTAVDAAVMLLDSAKGLEPQTLKLFEVCRRRGVPVITFVNKWDRPGREALELCDELEERINLRPTPLTWPIGEAGRFLGLLDRANGEVRTYRRAPGGASIAEESVLTPQAAADALGDDHTEAVESVQLLETALDRASFLAGTTTPMLFGAALANIGVRQLLDAVVDLAPRTGRAARRRRRGARRRHAVQRVRVQDAGRYGPEPPRPRGVHPRVLGPLRARMVVTHERTGRPFATKYALSVFGRERSTVEDAYPGDVVGLVNASTLAVGDTVFDSAGPRVRFPPMPVFAPEHFAAARGPTRAAPSSSARASRSSSRRASSRCWRPRHAATATRSWRPLARCSSRWRPSGWSTSSTRPSCSRRWT